MKTKELTEFSSEELQVEKKKRLTILIVFAILVGIMAGASAYGYYKKGFSGITLLPVAFLPLLMINISSYKQVTKEIASRAQ